VANCINSITLEVSDDFVPGDYDDLYKVYAPFVTRLVTRYNRVSANFDDLLQHVWVEILRVDLIKKYTSSTGSLPKKMTVEQVCAYLQMDWKALKIALIRGVTGDKRSKRSEGFSWAPEWLEVKVYERDAGTCHCCGRDTRKLTNFFKDHWLHSDREKYTIQMRRLVLPKDHQTWYYVGLDEAVPVGRDSTFEVRYKIFCTPCLLNRFKDIPKARARLRRVVKSTFQLRPIVGTYASKKAVYAREDVERFRLGRGINSRCKVNPDIKPLLPQSKPYFKLYLARSVHNIYANWCRTRKRRYKEHFPGIDPDTGKSWEDTLVDPYGPRQENLFALHQAISIFFSGRSDLVAAKNEEILSLVAKGLTAEEIVNKMRLPKHVLKSLIPPN
jgi:hypothetical protein